MVFLSVVPLIFLLTTGCGSKNNGLPLPSSAKKISTNTIQIPFPYSESINGEQWTLSRNSSNHLVVQVIDGGKIEKIFPVNTNITASITLGGQKYKVNHITVNSDNDSGFVTFFRQ